jgi:hypothetical protein
LIEDFYLIGEKMYRVYISGPITKGNKIQNLAQALEAYKILLLNGFAPFCPHLSMLTDDVLGRIPYRTWIETDLEWVKICHILLRLPGESPGAEEEVAMAEDNGIPVYDNITRLIATYGKKDESRGESNTSGV